ncbi:PTS lactose/cellobiose transporter subunit IIA [Bacillus massiliigorillae]|uniref:PTS lactose/cellobiose transporter subunit IIA n=1 Tax=Bacillus massiliigorillae TaxID=1243664 RepID=UPI0003A1C07E|nr:PTS lactose/cellobiose transporter subunit IIA [Bacillus massiliigorillae]
METIIMNIILHSGNARSIAMEAIQEAKKGNFEVAEKYIEEATQSLGDAHKSQTALIQGEARGEKSEVSILLIHAQDHLMTAMTLKDLAAEMVELYKRIK